MEPKTQIATKLHGIAGGRASLLILTVFTAINIALLMLPGEDTATFVFSAFFPPLCVATGRFLDSELAMHTFTAIGIAAALVILALYVVCYLLSKKRAAFLTVALVLFSLDTLILLYVSVSAGFEFSALIELLFHAYVLFTMINAQICMAKLKQFPPEEVAAVRAETDARKKGGKYAATPASPADQAGEREPSPFGEDAAPENEEYLKEKEAAERENRE